MARLVTSPWSSGQSNWNPSNRSDPSIQFDKNGLRKGPFLGVSLGNQILLKRSRTKSPPIQPYSRVLVHRFKFRNDPRNSRQVAACFKWYLQTFCPYRLGYTWLPRSALLPHLKPHFSFSDSWVATHCLFRMYVEISE